MRLRTRKKEEKPDSLGQTHLFETAFPQVRSITIKTRRYARPSFGKLAPEIQAQFLELIEEYLDEKWYVAEASDKPVRIR
jgi:hypothetical protein